MCLVTVVFIPKSVRSKYLCLDWHPLSQVHHSSFAIIYFPQFLFQQPLVFFLLISWQSDHSTEPIRILKKIKMYWHTESHTKATFSLNEWTTTFLIDFKRSNMLEKIEQLLEMAKDDSQVFAHSSYQYMLRVLVTLTTFNKHQSMTVHLLSDP